VRAVGFLELLEHPLGGLAHGLVACRSPLLHPLLDVWIAEIQGLAVTVDQVFREVRGEGFSIGTAPEESTRKSQRVAAAAQVPLPCGLVVALGVPSADGEMAGLGDPQAGIQRHATQPVGLLLRLRGISQLQPAQAYGAGLAVPGIITGQMVRQTPQGSRRRFIEMRGLGHGTDCLSAWDGHGK
jgi:hypothetical protein